MKCNLYKFYILHNPYIPTHSVCLKFNDCITYLCIVNIRMPCHLLHTKVIYTAYSFFTLNNFLLFIFFFYFFTLELFTLNVDFKCCRRRTLNTDGNNNKIQSKQKWNLFLFGYRKIPSLL